MTKSRWHINFLIMFCGLQACNASVFQNESFSESDAILVVDQSDRIIFEWQADKLMIPASLTKLATAYLAIKRWGLGHQFETDFYIEEDTLWVKGYGDPFIVSEELDLIALELAKHRPGSIKSIYIDSSHFDINAVPGHSAVTDPYNAPLSAVSVNFNTARLTISGGITKSAEPQTPLTPTAKKVAKSLTKKTERVNLVHEGNAQQNFAELLAIKLGLGGAVDIKINQQVPVSAQLIYRHKNSHTLEDVLRGTLEFSNNFMANQLFLKLASQVPLNFTQASTVAERSLLRDLKWSSHRLLDGSGLSRANRLSTRQIDSLLSKLQSNKKLFKQTKNPFAEVRAKTGTLDGVRSLAGYIDLPGQSYRFVFIFNRTVPWRYREQLLEKLVRELKSQ